MWIPTLVLFTMGALVSTSPSCTNVSSCFLKHLFDFSYPEENVYSIAFNDDLTSLDNVVLGYGDFNNDLHADYVAVNPNTNDLLVFFYRTEDSDYYKEGQYTLQLIQSPFKGCNPINIYLYDVDLTDQNLLDITIWGQYQNSTNCLYPLIQTTMGQFNTSIPPLNFEPTTQPIIFESSAMQSTTFLLLYDQLAEARKLLYFSLGNQYTLSQVSTINNWTGLFMPNNENIGFSSQHWNSFIDLTNDCQPEIVITNKKGQIQFWVWFTQANKYILSTAPDSLELNPNLQNDLHIQAITTLSFQDVDYDGDQELILGNSTSLMIYMNTLTQEEPFCQAGKTTIGLNLTNPMIVPAPANCALAQQNIQFGDLNIDGYPDLLFTCFSSDTQTNQLVIYLNNFDQEGGSFQKFDLYQTKIDSFIDKTITDVTRVSLFDILQNGILDIIVTVQQNRTVVLYNNYLYQNYFYIKGFATNGVTSTSGTQVPGVSFYWLNSLGNSQRIASYAQMFQTAYGAVPAPYVLTGLGKANNYVEQFTVGRLGKSKSWSPIIPNSQLAVYCGASESDNWSIKIFILPTDSLVYVLIVCIVILTLLGSVLACLKCRRKKKENYLYKALSEI